MNDVPRLPWQCGYCNTVEVSNPVSHLLPSVCPTQDIELFVRKHVNFKLLNETTLERKFCRENYQF